MNSNQFAFIRPTIYRLKIDYGFPIDIYVFRSSVVNLETGRKVVKKDKYHINRAIVMPTQLGHHFIYDLSFIAANKNFTYGGILDRKIKNFVIDIRDYPKGLVLQLQDFIIFDSVRYDFKQLLEFEHKQALLITTERTEGEAPQASFDEKQTDVITLDQTVSGEL